MLFPVTTKSREAQAFFEQGIEPAPTNIQFDKGLRARNASWGIRNVEELDKVAEREGLARTARHSMPANNLTLVYRRID